MAVLLLPGVEGMGWVAQGGVMGSPSNHSATKKTKYFNLALPHPLSLHLEFTLLMFAIAVRQDKGRLPAAAAAVAAPFTSRFIHADVSLPPQGARAVVAKREGPQSKPLK